MIPKEMRDALGMKEGDEVLIVAEGNVGPEPQGDRRLPRTGTAFVAVKTAKLVAELRKYAVTVISTVSVAEALVKPCADGRTERVDAFDRFMHSLPNSTCVAPDYETAKDAARLRGRYGLRTPDALLIATTRRHGGQAFLTNDDGLRKMRGEDLGVIVLDDDV